MSKIHYARFLVDGEVANLLRTCYGETGVMDFGLQFKSIHRYVVY